MSGFCRLNVFISLNVSYLFPEPSASPFCNVGSVWRRLEHNAFSRQTEMPVSGDSLHQVGF